MVPRSCALLALLLLYAGESALAAGPLAGAPVASGRAQLRDPWRPLGAGVKVASAADLGGDPAWAARVVLIDPSAAHLSVQFDAERPTIAQWRTRFPGALAFANGSFYSADERRGAVRPTCDLVLAGKLVRGAGCRRQDALFFGAVRAPPGSANTRAASQAGQKPGPREPAHDGGSPGPAGVAGSEAFVLAPEPGAARPSGTAGAPPSGCSVSNPAQGPGLFAPADFHPDEWAEALKSFPALVRSCQPACPGPHYCQERSRTSALAQLRDGKLVLFASQSPAVRREVGRFLAESLGAVDAVNLDGGPETTLSLRGEPLEESIGTPGTGLPLMLVLLVRAQ